MFQINPLQMEQRTVLLTTLHITELRQTLRMEQIKLDISFFLFENNVVEEGKMNSNFNV